MAAYWSPFVSLDGAQMAGVAVLGAVVAGGGVVQVRADGDQVAAEVEELVLPHRVRVGDRWAERPTVHRGSCGVQAVPDRRLAVGGHLVAELGGVVA